MRGTRFNWSPFKEVDMTLTQDQAITMAFTSSRLASDNFTLRDMVTDLQTMNQRLVAELADLKGLKDRTVHKEHRVHRERKVCKESREYRAIRQQMTRH